MFREQLTVINFIFSLRLTRSHFAFLLFLLKIFPKCPSLFSLSRKNKYRQPFFLMIQDHAVPCHHPAEDGCPWCWAVDVARRWVLKDTHQICASPLGIVF